MRIGLFTKAIKDGDYIPINAFDPGIGENCGCTCPVCGKPVRSNVTAKSSNQLKISYTDHFSHINPSSCDGGYKETELHLFAKKVLEKNKSFKVPSEQYHFPKTLYYSKVILEKLFTTERFQQYRPDIILIDPDGNKIVVEVIVTNPVSEVKKQLYKEEELKSIQIDMSKYERREIDLLREELERDIIENDKIKKWIWPILNQDIDDLHNFYKRPKTNKANQENVGCILFLSAIIFLSLIYLFNIV